MILFTGDLHFTEKLKDEYRWRIIPWLAKKAKAKGVKDIIIAGDLTDAKDHHPSVLVNRLCDELRAHKRIRWHILKGNHDYGVDPSNPFFRFLQDVKCKFYVEPEYINVMGRNVLMLPHSRKPTEKWDGHSYETAECIVTHQTYQGADAGGGIKLDGLPNNWFSTHGKRKGVPVISGDIHVPQRCGEVLYTGAPHPIKYGDDHKTRVLWWTGEKMVSIPYPSIHKHKLVIDDPKELKKKKFWVGDQADITVRLERTDFPEWETIQQAVRSYVEKKGVVVNACRLVEKQTKEQVEGTDLWAEAPTGKAPSEVVKEFCKARGLSKPLERVGVDIVKSIA